MFFKQPFVSIPLEDISPLHFAALGNNTELIQKLLQKESYTQPKDGHGSTPLHYAVGMGNLKTCKVLIEKFHDKNPYDHDLLTPLHIGKKKFWSKILPLDDIN